MKPAVNDYNRCTDYVPISETAEIFESGNSEVAKGKWRAGKFWFTPHPPFILSILNESTTLENVQINVCDFAYLLCFCQMGLSPMFRLNETGEGVSRIRAHRQAESAVTKYRVLDSRAGCSLVELEPLTGTRSCLLSHRHGPSSRFETWACMTLCSLVC